jgi:hypothetical protein
MRKEVEITIEEGRDKGKTFKITEMSATQADRWTLKVLCLFGKGGIVLEELAKMDFNTIIKTMGDVGYDIAEPLLDELLECASFKKDGVYVPMKGSMIESVVEDFRTLYRLRLEALQLVLGFLEQGGESKSK